MAGRGQGHSGSGAEGPSPVGAEKKTQEGVLSQIERIIDSARGAFKQERTFERGRRLILSRLACLGRHTVTGLISASGGQFADWSADYRLFSKDRFDKDEIFAAVRKEAASHIEEGDPVVCCMDDSIMRKKGRKIPGAGWARDPLGPPFRVNLAWAQRLLQVSMIVPPKKEDAPGRAVPIEFLRAPLPKKPRADSDPESWEQYRKLKEETNISRLGAERLRKLRKDLDGDQRTAGKKLWVAVDGRFTTKKVFGEIPERTAVIGRLRKDARLFHPPAPEDQPKRAGRKKSYGKPAPTPEELRTDQSAPWQTVSAFAAGKVHNFRVKVVHGLLWRPAGPNRPLMLVVIAPLAYRPSKKSKVLYRQPAYLACTDPGAPLEKIIQAYVWRWEIEVNFRDQKQLVGMGEAQVWNHNSVENDPALAVAAYAILLLAGIKAFPGQNASLPPPKWRKKSKPRLSTQDLINQLRFELWGKAMGVEIPTAYGNEEPKMNFEGFTDGSSIDKKPEKLIPQLASAVLYATG